MLKHHPDVIYLDFVFHEVEETLIEVRLAYLSPSHTAFCLAMIGRMACATMSSILQGIPHRRQGDP